MSEIRSETNTTTTVAPLSARQSLTGNRVLAVAIAPEFIRISDGRAQMVIEGSEGPTATIALATRSPVLDRMARTVATMVPWRNSSVKLRTPIIAANTATTTEPTK